MDEAKEEFEETEIKRRKINSTSIIVSFLHEKEDIVERCYKNSSHLKTK